MATNSEAAKKRWRDPNYRAKQLISFSERQKRLWTDKSYRRHHTGLLKVIWSDPERRKRLSMRHRQNGVRWRSSFGARRLHRRLGRGWKLEYWVSWSRYRRYAVDVAYPEMKLAIEVDGRTHDSLEQKRKDRRRDFELRTLGWSVFRVSEAGCRLI